VDGGIAETFGVRTERKHMANVSTPWRSAFVVDSERELQFSYVANEWIAPLPREDIEDVVATL
jgi:peroxiredoxin